MCNTPSNGGIEKIILIDLNTGNQSYIVDDYQYLEEKRLEKVKNRNTKIDEILGEKKDNI